MGPSGDRGHSRDDTDMTSEHAKIIRLARSFPTLEDAPLEPWDPVAFDAWAAGPGPPAR